MTAALALIVEASLRGSVILLAALVVVHFMRRRAAGERELILRMALLAFTVLPIFNALLPEVPVPLGSIRPGDTIEERAATASWTTIAVGVWVAGVLFMLARTAATIFAIARTARDARPFEHPLAERFGKLRVEVRTSPRTRVAMTWGTIRPLILLPDRDRDNDAVLLHEIAHVMRRDSLLLALAAIVKSIHWFNPFVHGAVARMRAESERACDDIAILHGALPLDLAEELVRIRGEQAASIVAAMASPSSLEERIAAILDPSVRRSAPELPLLFASAACSLLIVAWLSAFAPERRPDTDSFASAYGISSRLASDIIEAANEERIPVDVAFALVETESGFNGLAVSRRGAIGLTQLLPSTARNIDPALSREDLFFTRPNLRTGFRHLRNNIDRYRSLPVALTAYNLGAPAVDRLRAARKPLPSEYREQVLASIRR